jgi:hypothetical protein
MGMVLLLCPEINLRAQRAKLCGLVSLEKAFLF